MSALLVSWGAESCRTTAKRKLHVAAERPVMACAVIAKNAGERSAGNPHATFDEAGAGNEARITIK
jgi:hypothetical protein